jgi:C-terminal processing protease CtpA/Prc
LSVLNPYGEPDPVAAESTPTNYGRYVRVTTDRYDYGAVYFVKQRFLFGALCRDLNDSERRSLQSDQGAVVVTVVDDSPAFNADVLAGDIIISVDGVVVAGRKAADAMMEARKGKQVMLTFVRAGERIEKSVQLND